MSFLTATFIAVCWGQGDAQIRMPAGTACCRPPSDWLGHFAEMLRHVGDILRRDVGVIRQVETVVMNLVCYREMRHAVLLDPERLAAHRATHQWAALDTRCQQVLGKL